MTGSDIFPILGARGSRSGIISPTASWKWLGWGIDTSHTLDFRNPHGAHYVYTTIPASHPHNVVAQLWVEIGVPGLALGLAFALLTLRRAGRIEPHLAPFGAWAAALTLALTAYSFWTDSLYAAFALTGFAFALEKIKMQRGSNSTISSKVNAGVAWWLARLTLR